jgi:hypothetical protein
LKVPRRVSLWISVKISTVDVDRKKELRVVRTARYEMTKKNFLWICSFKLTLFSIIYFLNRNNSLEIKDQTKSSEFSGVSLEKFEPSFKMETSKRHDIAVKTCVSANTQRFQFMHALKKILEKTADNFR